MSSVSKRFLTARSALLVQPLLTALTVLATLFMLAAIATEDADAKTHGGGTFRGTTSQGYPGYVKTSSLGASIDKATIPILVKCTFGPMVLPQKFEFVVVKPSGRFKETGSAADEEEGVLLQLSESFSGKFNRERTSVVTKSRIYLTFHAPDGSVETCDSGVVTMHAHI